MIKILKTIASKYLLPFIESQRYDEAFLTQFTLERWWRRGVIEERDKYRSMGSAFLLPLLGK